jgi:hypothetical protein
VPTEVSREAKSEALPRYNESGLLARPGGVLGLS